MKIFRVIFLVSAGILGVILLVYYAAWRPPRVPAKIDLNDENLINESNFLAVKEPGGSGGIEGEADKIKMDFENFKPDILLVEGRKDFFIPVLMDPVARFGIAGRARELALKNNIEIYSTDMPEKDIYTELIKKYPARNAEAALIVYSYITKKEAQPTMGAEYGLRECLKEKRNAGLCREIKSVSDIESVLAPQGISVSTLRLNGKVSPMQDSIWTDIKRLKAGYINRLINYYLRQNKKVFMVYNSPEDETAIKAYSK